MNSPINVTWKRFWCPREESYHLTGNGYLPNFDNEFYLGNSKITTLEKLFDIPCLILLGEPGIGKSNEIAKHSTFIEEKIRETRDEVLTINMKDYTSEQRLFDDIFKSPILKKWCEGENRLYLVLDSFDEALLDIKTLSSAIPNKIKSEKLPTIRLYLRIVSRVADWPTYLEEQLQLIWGKDRVSAYELLPLRKIDVEEFAKVNGIDDSNVFIEDIEARDGQPFAIRPVTLKFLTKIYLQDGNIPKSKIELYSKGCLYLCTEESSRINSSRAGNLSREQKMKIAGRIAALSLFSNKASIWNGTFDDDAQESDLIKQSLYGGQEVANGANFDVNLDGVNEALNTGLFSAIGSERLGWSHRTYAEFLAAWYLNEHNFDDAKILSLISHPGDRNQRLIPQLQETAAWLATFSEKVFDILKDRNPEVLLRSDVILSNEAFRASLVNVLLAKHDSEELFELGWDDIY